MVRRTKAVSIKILSLLTAVTLCLTVFTIPVSAQDGNGNPKQKDEKTKIDILEDVDTNVPEPVNVVPVLKGGRWNRVHSNQTTFEKNFILSPEQKEYSITEYEKVVSEILEPEMSDLEKYYTLAIWLNHYVDYDWDFWPAGYDFDYYSHQWDAIGILKERKSVCAGIAIAYANLCHAADLPCKFIRMKPFYLDHTINYIPDINGHGYYIDVTENYFFMSEVANPWNPLDLEFAPVPEAQIPDDGSFEYREDNEYLPSGIKEYYGVAFDKWFTEYALHKGTDKKFRAEYEEKGSGTRGIHRASYRDYPKQYSYTEKPGLWFLEDFYKDPEMISSKVCGKEFDEQLLNISGVQGSYDCNSAEELAAAVRNDMEIKFFPSEENGQVVPKSTPLNNNIDYSVSCDAFDPLTGEATITITGTGAYSGKCQIPVRFNTAAAAKAPVNKTDLTYTREMQELIEPGTVENGTILYACCLKSDEGELWRKGDPDAAPYPKEPNVLYSEKIPTEMDAGRYVIWYKIEGDKNHFDVPPQRLERAAIISPAKPKILVDNKTTEVGKSIKLSPELDMDVSVEYDYVSLDDTIATVSSNGLIKGVAPGTATIAISGTVKENDPNFEDPENIEISVRVSKGENPMKLKSKTAKVRRSKLLKKAQKIKRSRLIAVSNAQGRLTYKLVSVKKDKKSFRKYFKLNPENGTVTVKKGLKKGRYLVKIKVRSAGNANYEPSSWKTVTTKVRVR